MLKCRAKGCDEPRVNNACGFCEKHNTPTKRKEAKVLNPYRHWYLYAKGHYDTTSDVIEDLKIVQADYCGIEPERISVGDVLFMVIDRASHHLRAGDARGYGSFMEFVNDVIREPYHFQEPDTRSVSERVVDACLKVLRYTNLSEIDGVLGEPDLTGMIQRKIQHIMNAVEETGHDIYMVGGCVRDHLMKQEPKDIDFATNCPMEMLEEMFDCHDIGANKTFGIVCANVGGENFEIAQFRTESDYSDGRHPSVVQLGATFEEDVKRRDFTINGLGMDAAGNVIDHVGGVADIERKMIRAIGDPNKRFQEDGLRILRMFRFAARFKFLIDVNTLLAAKDNRAMLEKLAKERITEELLKTASYGGEAFADYVMKLDSYEMLSYVHPRIAEMFDVKYVQNVEHHPEGPDVGIHVIQALRSCESKDPLTIMALFLHDIGKPVTYEEEVNPEFKGGIRYRYNNHDQAGLDLIKEVAEKLKFSKELTNACLFACKNHMRYHKLDEMKNSKILALVNHPEFERLQEVSHADAVCRGERFKEENRRRILDKIEKVKASIPTEAEAKVRDLVNGHLVMEVAGAEGPEIGRIKREVQAWALDEMSGNVTEAQVIEKLKEFK